MQHFDVVVIGSGLAGMTAALELASHGRVALVSKRALVSGASHWAQGGIAAVWAESDSVDAHCDDTVMAGALLCDADMVRYVVEHGADAIRWLQNQGVAFTTEALDSASLHLTREGGHSHRRVVHVADATGLAIQTILAEQVRIHERITVFENHIAIDLVTSRHRRLQRQDVCDAVDEPSVCCYGAYILNALTGDIETLVANHTILACGGAGKVYLYTTNPDTASGDGIAMAWRAGCRVANMEFMQFHPTCLYHPHAASFLISEALRGEGGILRLGSGEAFMPWHDQRADLAPRDVVARAIDFEMKKRGLDCVYLDITHKPSAFIQEHFPTIYARCLALGIDITTQWIPVVPAAHYTCGGVVTDRFGHTDVKGLYAIGETAYTGLHGANRLASNSLLECVVFGRAVAAAILKLPIKAPPDCLPDWDASRVVDADEEVVIAHNWDELRRCMWNYVGIVRTNKRLERAAHRIALLQQEVHEFYVNFRVTGDLIELRNLLTCAELIVRAALSRTESRGLHFSVDYPDTAEVAQPTMLIP